METDSMVQTEATADADVMASIEDGSVETFVIADVSTDDAYLTMPLAEAATLPAWR